MFNLNWNKAPFEQINTKCYYPQVFLWTHMWSSLMLMCHVCEAFKGHNSHCDEHQGFVRMWTCCITNMSLCLHECCIHRTLYMDICKGSALKYFSSLADKPNCSSCRLIDWITGGNRMWKPIPLLFPMMLCAPLVCNRTKMEHNTVFTSPVKEMEPPFVLLNVDVCVRVSACVRVCVRVS